MKRCIFCGQEIKSFSYEDIRQAHRKEKDNELQELPFDFLKNLDNFIEQRRNCKDTTSLLEVENALKLNEDIQKRRIRKIVFHSLQNFDRDTIPPKNMTEKERNFYNMILELLGNYYLNEV